MRKINVGKQTVFCMFPGIPEGGGGTLISLHGGVLKIKEITIFEGNIYF